MKFKSYFDHFFMSKFAVYAILLLFILIQKVNVITGQVFTDELFYGAVSKLIHKNIIINNSLPDSLIFFYPFITSWIYYFDVNHIFYLRLIDQFISIFFYFLVYRCFNIIIKNYFFSFILTIYLLFKTHLYVNAGYNNSIIISYIFLVYAFIVYNQNLKKPNFLKIGILVVISIFFREANIFFGLIIFSSIFFFQREFLLKFILGALCTAIFFLVFLVIFRENHINSIYNLPYHYKSFYLNHLFYGKEHIWQDFKGQGYLFIKKNADVFLILYTLSIINFDNLIKKTNIYKFLFFIFFSFAPLIETFFKFANNYHFANMYLGMFGLLSINILILNKKYNFYNLFLKYSIYPFCFLIIFLGILYNNFSAKNLSNFKFLISNNNWPQNITDNSNYLLLKKTIEKEYKKNYTFLSADPEIYTNSLVDIDPPTYQILFLDYFLEKHNLTNYRQDKFSYINFLIKTCQPNMIYLPNQILGKNLILLDVKKINNNLINSGYILKKIVITNPNSAYNQFDGKLFIKNNVDKCLL
jgi:hypothetical protein